MRPIDIPELISVEQLGISSFEEMERKYKVVELNTAVKPFYIEYLYRRDPGVDIVMYVDPDVQVFGSFRRVEETLSTYNVVITPHSCKFDDTESNTVSKSSCSEQVSITLALSRLPVM